jgi:hypothetical protein
LYFRISQFTSESKTSQDSTTGDLFEYHLFFEDSDGPASEVTSSCSELLTRELSVA